MHAIFAWGVHIYVQQPSRVPFNSHADSRTPIPSPKPSVLTDGPQETDTPTGKGAWKEQFRSTCLHMYAPNIHVGGIKLESDEDSAPRGFIIAIFVGVLSVVCLLYYAQALP